MDEERYRRLSEAFEGSRALSAVARAEFLAEACADDADLRRDVEELLELYDRDDHPVGEAAAEAGRARLAGFAADADVDETADDSATPDEIGPYRVLRRIGVGGMGVVYEAEQDRPRRRVALKVLHTGQAHGEQLRRFRREAELLARLHHPGIAQVYAAETVDRGQGEQPWFAMELVEGLPLVDYAERNGLDRRARLELVATVCDAVQHAHDRGIVHRDLKPDNVLVDSEGRPKVLDFGVARASDQASQLSTVHTAQGEILGTITHMAPEQLDGDPDAVGPPADVWALGVILFELLTGRLPYDLAGLSLTAAVRVLGERDPKRLSELDRSARGDLETIVAKALEPDPARRFPTPATFAADLRRFVAHEPIQARRPGRLYRARRFARRRPAVAGMLLVATLAATFVARFAVLESRARADAELERETALRERETADEERARADQGEVATRAALYGSIAETLQSNPWRARELLLAIDPEQRDWVWSWLMRQGPFTFRPQLVEGQVGRFADPVLASERQLLLGLSTGAGIDNYRIDLAWPSRLTLVRAGLHHNLKVIDSDRAIGWLRGEEGERFGGAILLDLNTGETIEPIPHTGPGWALTDWTESGLMTATDRNSTVRAQSAAEIGPVLVSHPSLHHYDLASDAQRFAYSMGSSLTVVDPASAEVIWEHQFEAKILTLAFAPDGATLAVFDGRELWLFDSSTGRELRRFPGPTQDSPWNENLTSVDWSGDGRVVGAHSSRGNALLYDADSGEVLFDFGERSIDVPDGGRLELGPRGRMAVVAALDSVDPWVVDTRGEEERRFTPLEAAPSYVYWMAVAPDGGLVAATAPFSAAISIWDAWSGEIVARIPLLGGPVAACHGFLDFSVSGRHLVYTGLAEGGGYRAMALDLVTGETTSGPDRAWEDFNPLPSALTADMATLTGKAAPGLNGRSVLHPDGERLFATRPQAFQSSAQRPLSTEWEDPQLHVGILRGLDVSPDGELLAIGIKAGHFASVVVVRTADGSRVAEVPPAPGGDNYAVRWSPDGRLLAVGNESGEVRVLETRFFNTLATLPRHDDYVMDLAWSPDGETLYSASGDGTVRLWDSVHPIPRRFRIEDRVEHARDAAAQLEGLVDQQGDRAHAAELLWNAAGDDIEARIAARRAAIGSWADQ